MKQDAVRYLKTNLDEALIVASVGAVWGGRHLSQLTEQDEVVLAAFARYSGQTQDLEATSEYLRGMSEDQLLGVVSNVKGILHEMEYVRYENSDGDSLTAAIFPDTNHKSFDVVLTDSESGYSGELQLKATDNADYVQEWVDAHPEGEILVTEELAAEMGLESSGFSNEELTARVEDVVDALIAAGPDAKVWHLIPGLALISISFAVYELHRRHQDGSITSDEFKELAVKVTGIKVAKISLRLVGLSIPGRNVVVGTALVAHLSLWPGQAWFRRARVQAEGRVVAGHLPGTDDEFARSWSGINRCAGSI